MRLVLPADAPGVEVVHRHRAILAPSCIDNGYDHQNGRLHNVYAQVKKGSFCKQTKSPATCEEVAAGMESHNTCHSLRELLLYVLW